VLNGLYQGWYMSIHGVNMEYSISVAYVFLNTQGIHKVHTRYTQGIHNVLLCPRPLHSLGECLIRLVHSPLD